MPALQGSASWRPSWAACLPGAFDGFQSRCTRATAHAATTATGRARRRSRRRCPGVRQRASCDTAPLKQSLATTGWPWPPPSSALAIVVHARQCVEAPGDVFDVAHQGPGCVWPAASPQGSGISIVWRSTAGSFRTWFSCGFASKEHAFAGCSSSSPAAFRGCPSDLHLVCVQQKNEGWGGGHRWRVMGTFSSSARQSWEREKERTIGLFIMLCIIWGFARTAVAFAAYRHRLPQLPRRPWGCPAGRSALRRARRRRLRRRCNSSATWTVWPFSRCNERERDE